MRRSSSRKAIRTDELEPLIQKKFGILLANPGFHIDNLGCSLKNCQETQVV